MLTKRKNQRKNTKKKVDLLNSKTVLQQQMEYHEKLKEESKAEYMRDKQLVDDIVKKNNA